MTCLKIIDGEYKPDSNACLESSSLLVIVGRVVCAQSLSWFSSVSTFLANGLEM